MEVLALRVMLKVHLGKNMLFSIKKEKNNQVGTSFEMKMQSDLLRY